MTFGSSEGCTQFSTFTKTVLSDRDGFFGGRAFDVVRVSRCVLSEADVGSMLEGVDDSRAGWYMGKWDAARPVWIDARKKRADEATSREKGARKRVREGD
jgi:hypothetical protein